MGDIWTYFKGPRRVRPDNKWSILLAWATSFWISSKFSSYPCICFATIKGWHIFCDMTPFTCCNVTTKHKKTMKANIPRQCDSKPVMLLTSMNIGVPILLPSLPCVIMTAIVIKGSLSTATTFKLVFYYVGAGWAVEMDTTGPVWHPTGKVSQHFIFTHEGILYVNHAFTLKLHNRRVGLYWEGSSLHCCSTKSMLLAAQFPQLRPWPRWEKALRPKARGGKLFGVIPKRPCQSRRQEGNEVRVLHELILWFQWLKNHLTF